jgi:tripartite ATP-independent transporter DctM subunit
MSHAGDLNIATADRTPVTPAGGRNLADTVLKLVTEVPAALLVLAEILVLSTGVVARYVFHRPITWSDELATSLFLWLVMFGAAIALRRGEHMRLTTLVDHVGPVWRARLEALGAGIIAVVLVAIVVASRDHVEDQWVVITPALRIRDGMRVMAIPIGAILMIATLATQAISRGYLKQLAGALTLLAVIAVALWLGGPALKTIGNANLAVFFVGCLGVCIAVGVPIGFAFGVSTLAYLAFTTNAPMSILVSRMDEGMSELILLAVPLFILLGLLIEMTGMARALIDFLASLLGHVRGGLSYVLLGAMYLVSGISGSKVADMAAIAPVLFPEMKRRGTPPGELVALLASSGAMSETIPPSLVLLTIGSVTGVSIAALFTGGLLPAAIGALALGIVTAIRAPQEDLTGVRKLKFPEVMKLLLIALPALVLPFLIRAAVVEGVATATEVSTVGIAYTILVGLLLYRQFDWRAIYPMLTATASLTGAVLFIIGMATCMAWALTQSGFSQQLASAMAATPGGKAGFLAISIVVFAVLGSVLEGIPAIVLFGPLLFPAARAIGVHDVQYAMVVILAMGIGLFAPPFGIGYYAACMIGGAIPDEAMRRIWPYLAALFAATALVAAVPWLSIGFL